MNNITLQTRIDTEVTKWEHRVYFPDLKFKNGTQADLNLLYKYMSKADEGIFSIISSETMACVYKIGRFFIEKSIPNKRITFITEDELLPYIDPNTLYAYQARDLCDKYINKIKDKIAKKWIFIPDMNSISWSTMLASYFINSLKQSNAYGIIFYSDKDCPESFAQILCEETYLDVLQFPAKKFKTKREINIIENDNY